MKVVTAERAHIEDFLSRPIRQEDLDEWVLASGKPVPGELRAAFEAPGVVRACVDDTGRCLAIWGRNEAGFVWLIASHAALRHGRSIARLWPGEEALFMEGFERVAAASWVNNHLHHEWLMRMGFRCVGLAEHTVTHAQFFMFEKTRDDKPCAIQ